VDAAGVAVHDREIDAVAHDDPVGAVDARVEAEAALQVAEDHVERNQSEGAR
jgi:hypothetical protein